MKQPKKLTALDRELDFVIARDEWPNKFDSWYARLVGAVELAEFLDAQFVKYSFIFAAMRRAK
jgi:hypothetical protein